MTYVTYNFLKAEKPCENVCFFEDFTSSISYLDMAHLPDAFDDGQKSSALNSATWNLIDYVVEF